MFLNNNTESMTTYQFTNLPNLQKPSACIGLQPEIENSKAESVTAESVNKANLKRLTKAELNEMANSYLCSYGFYCLVRRELECRKTTDKGKRLSKRVSQEILTKLFFLSQETLIKTL